MPFEFDSELADLSESFKKIRSDFDDMQERIGDVSGTASSDDGFLEMTITEGGILSKVDVVGTSYRQMAGAELAKVILETFEAAHKNFQESLVEIMPESPFEGVSTSDFVRGEADWSKVLPQRLAEIDIEMPGRFESQANQAGQVKKQGRVD